MSPFVNISTIAITFRADFQSVIGGRGALFVQECTLHIQKYYSFSLECMSVSAGSIILIIQGPRFELQDVFANITENGLELPSFEALFATGSNGEARVVEENSEVETTGAPKSNHMNRAVLILVMWAFAMSILYYCSTRTSKMDEDFYQPMIDPNELTAPYTSIQNERL